MKKSFKKAGAAVLSMSMLLAMGAVSMPVYADEYTHQTPQGQPWPGQVEVSLGHDNWADGDNANQKFSYLSNIKDAEVRIYKVATHTGAGWRWDTAFINAVENDPTNPGNSPKTNVSTLTDWQNLLARDATTNKFTATSAELQKLASALERVVLDSNGAFKSSPASMSSGKIDSTNNHATIYLPHDDQLDAPTGTEDVIGYYLISTVTSDAGVVIQPALISLKNSVENDPDGTNPRQITLKGNIIDVDKEITTVESDQAEKSLVAGGSVSSSKDTAVASADDTVKFTINTQLPKYDVNLTPSELEAVTLTDTPDAGVTILNTAGTAVNGLKVYAGTQSDAVTTELNTNDYTITPNTPTGGFTITFKSNALRYGTNDASETITQTASTATKLEGQYIKVEFTGKVNDNIKKGVSTTKTYATLTKVEIEAMKDMANSLKMKNSTKYTTALGDTNLDATAKTALLNTLYPTDPPAALTNDELVAAYLALEKANNAGSENVATLQFGNEYSTGKHTVKREDRVKVFSVDLDLTKIADQLLIERSDIEDSQAYKEDGSPAASKKLVEGAVLELKKLDDPANNGLVGAVSYGLAITDQNGIPHLLAEAGDGETVVYTQTVGGATKNYKDTGRHAWDNLTVGKYQLSEVKAPSGYREFVPIQFTISDTGKVENTDEYSGVFAAGSYTVTDGKTDINSIINDTDGTKGQLKFNTTNGNLEGEIKDPIADTLPATGGIGTVLFTAGGIAVVLAAGALFVIYMKKREVEE